MPRIIDVTLPVRPGMLTYPGRSGRRDRANLRHAQRRCLEPVDPVDEHAHRDPRRPADPFRRGRRDDRRDRARHVGRPGARRRHARRGVDRSAGAGRAGSPVRRGAPPVPHRLVGTMGGAVAGLPGRRAPPSRPTEPGGSSTTGSAWWERTSSRSRPRTIPRSRSTARCSAPASRSSRAWICATSPAGRYTLWCLPLKIPRGDGGPARVVLVERLTRRLRRAATTDRRAGSRTPRTTCRTPTTRAPTA